jgi:hypothetical protein
MKKNRLVLSALLVLGTLSLQAQNLNVKSKSGSKTTYAVKNQVKNLTFANGNLQVGTKTGGNDTYSLTSLRALTFDYTLTNVSEIETIEKPSIKLYPNPTSDILAITGLGKTTAQVSILNLQGQLVKKGELSPDQTSVSIANLENGIYFIKINTGSSQETIKLIKK